MKDWGKQEFMDYQELGTRCWLFIVLGLCALYLPFEFICILNVYLN